MSERAGRRILVFVALCIGGLALAICCSGCFGRTDAVTTDASLEYGEKGVTVTPTPPSPPPVGITWDSGAEQAPYVPVGEAASFPWGIWLGLMAVGATVCVGALLVGMKPLVPVIAAATIVAATAAVVKLLFWEILLGLLGVAVVGALAFGLMWFIRSRQFKEVVTKLQVGRESSEDFKVLMNEALVGELSQRTTKVVDKMRGKE